MAILASSAMRFPMMRLYFRRTYLMIASSNALPAVLIEREMAMPLKDSTPMSVVPPPMSTIKVPCGSSILTPAPIAAATGSSIRQIFRTPAELMAFTTARFSTSVIKQGTLTTTRGIKTLLPLICFI